MTDMFTAPDGAEALRGLCGNEVHFPGEDTYEGGRVGWNVAVDQRPAAVAYPRDASDVAAVVRAAAAAGLGIAAQRTGHNCATLGGTALADAVLVRTDRMDGVTFDAASGTCRVQGGALWATAIDAAATVGRAVMHGSAPDIGIAGYCVGGGLGWYARRHGLACNHVTAIELVVGDGSLVRTDRQHDPELFWALRGGGGSFGVVTALELETLDLPSVQAGMMVWDIEHAPRVLGTWAQWAPTAPRSATTAFRILHLPPLPSIPEPLRGRSLAVLDGAIAASDPVAERELGWFRALRPEIDTFARVGPQALAGMHMDPPEPTPSVSGSGLLKHLPAAGVDAFVATLQPGSTSLLSAELRQLGGALAEPAEGSGVLSHLPGQFSLFSVAVAVVPEMAAAGRASVGALDDSLAPYRTGREYLNLCEREVDPQSLWSAADHAGLQAVRERVDPGNVLVANHPV